MKTSMKIALFSVAWAIISIALLITLMAQPGSTVVFIAEILAISSAISWSVIAGICITYRKIEMEENRNDKRIYHKA